MEEKTNIGARLKAERERLGLGQLDLAEPAGVTRNTQWAYEKGERAPDAMYLACAATLGVDVQFVVTGVRTQATGLTQEQAELLGALDRTTGRYRVALLHLAEVLADYEPGSRHPLPPVPAMPPGNREVRPGIDQAMAALASAESVGDIARGASAFTQALGLERYTLVAFRGQVVTQMIHNAPPGIEKKLAVLDDSDPVLARAKMSHIPVVWESGSGGEWRERIGDFGYRCGVAGAAFDGSGTGCVLMVSSSDEKLPEDHLSTLLGRTLMAAVTVNDPLRKVASVVEAAKPSAQEKARRFS